MTVKELSQLYYLNLEIEMDQVRLDQLDSDIQGDEELLEEMKRKAGSPSSPNYDGMPKSPNYENRLEIAIAKCIDFEETIKHKKALRSAIAKVIETKQLLCLKERNKLECYIAELPTSLLRMIFTYRFINGLSWEQVSESIGWRTTSDSVKQMCYRYLRDEKI